jgi:hypothetical protein
MSLFPPTYSNIKSARAVLNQNEGALIWAMDNNVRYTAGDGTYREYIGKRFVVAKLHSILHYIRINMEPSFYEVIQTGGPVKMYFDIEEITSDLTPERASAVATILYRLIIR